MTTAIETKNLEVRYGDHVALCGLNLAVHAGTSLAVIGPNGSGKSTLLGALAKLYKPTNGTVVVHGGEPSFVLQSTEVATGLPITVRDAVRLARYPSVGIFGRFGTKDNDAVDDAMARMNVADLADETLHHLSGGQRQRVLMAQGLAQQSPTLLLDEPMTGLDLTSRRLVLDIVAEEAAAGRTVIMTTHSLADAAECDLALLLNTTAIAFGSPAEVLTETTLRQAFKDRVLQIGDELILDDHHAH